MSFARTILYNIAVDINKPTNSMDNLADLLEANFCDTQEALSSLSLAELKEMGLPHFIALKVTQAMEQINGHKDNKTKKDIAKQKKKTGPKRDKLLLASLKMRMEGINDNFLTKKEKLDSLWLMKRIVQNVLKKPEEEKFRTLKKDNPKLNHKLWRFFYIEEFFFLLNFHLDKKKNIIYLEKSKVNIDTLKLGIEVIDEEIEKAVAMPDINPYQAGFSSNNPNFHIKKVGEMSGFEQSKFAVAFQKLKEDRERLLKNHKVKQVVRIKKKSGDFNMKGMQDNYNEKEEAKMELNLFKKRVIEFQRSFTTNINFSNRSKKEFEEFLKQPLHLDTVARIKLPDGTIIEANFAANAKIDSIFSLLDLRLKYQTGYFLYVAPGVKNKLDPEDKRLEGKRFCDLGFVPNVLLNLAYHKEELNKEKEFLMNG